MISSINSSATESSTAVKLHNSQWKSRWQSYASTTWYMTPRMCRTTCSKFWRTVRMSIWHKVLCGCLTIPPRVSWLMHRNTRLLAACRLSIEDSITFQMWDCSLFSAGCRVSDSYHLWLKSHSFCSPLDRIWGSIMPNAYWSLSICRQYSALRSITAITESRFVGVEEMLAFSVPCK